jgi:hypothetical protein
MLILLGAGGVALLGWWFEGAGASVPRAGLAGLVWLVAARLVWHSWVYTVTSTWHWNGVLWRLVRADAGFGELPLEGILWVCMQKRSGRRNWLRLERRDAPQRWSDLRRAVYSRPGPEGSLQGGPAVARPEA